MYSSGIASANIRLGTSDAEACREVNRTRMDLKTAHRNLPTTRPRAFTLIELLIVAVIMSMLFAIIIPSFKKAREDARRTVCIAHLKHIGVGVFAYSNDFRDWGPRVMDPMGTTAPRTMLSRTGELVNLGLTWKHSIADAKVFLCPSQKNWSYNPRVQDMPAYTIAGSYAYAVHVPAGQSPKLAAKRHLGLVSEDFVSRIGDPNGMGFYSHKRGYNVLYTDGSALWYSDPDESIWKRDVEWDDETDDINYDTLYDPNAEIPPDQYGSAMDIFRIWFAFCYDQPDEYPEDILE